MNKENIYLIVSFFLSAIIGLFVLWSFNGFKDLTSEIKISEAIFPLIISCGLSMIFFIIIFSVMKGAERELKYHQENRERWNKK